MEENEARVYSGRLYCVDTDGGYALLDRHDILSIDQLTNTTDDISPPLGDLASLECSFDMLAKECQEIISAITGLYRALITCCPNKRVVHLASRGKKARTRKKNCKRAIRLLEEI